jgi:hypothetical protein
MNKKITSVVIFLAALISLSNTNWAAVATISLKQHWNLISIPVQPTDTSISSVLSSINGKYLAVYAYDGNNYEAYIPGASSNPLKKIEAGRGYWVYMNDAATLTVEGSEASKNVNLKIGWNLVGYSSTQSVPIAQGIASVGNRVTAVYAFDSVANSYQGYVPPSISVLTSLDPGRGYWMYATENATWAIPGGSTPTPEPGKPKVIFDIDITKGQSSLPQTATVTGGKWEAGGGWRTTGVQGERILLDSGYNIKSGTLEVSFATNQLPWTTLPKPLPSPAPVDRTHKLNFIGMYELPDLLQCTGKTRPCPPNRQPDILYIRTGRDRYKFVMVKAYVEGADEKLWEQSTGNSTEWSADDKTIYKVKLEWKNGTGIFHDPTGQQYSCPGDCMKKLDALRYVVLGSDNYAAGSPKGIRFISVKLTDYNE